MSTTSLTQPKTLSTEQFLDAVHGAEPKTAVFDFDGTLWPGDAGSGFMRWSIETGLLSRSAAEALAASSNGLIGRELLGKAGIIAQAKKRCNANSARKGSRAFTIREFADSTSRVRRAWWPASIT